MLPSPIKGPIPGYPFIELERAHAQAKDARSVFDAESFYTTSSPWMATVGVRLRFGPPHARMGRYGVALPAGPAIRALGIPSGSSPSTHQH